MNSQYKRYLSMKETYMSLHDEALCWNQRKECFEYRIESDPSVQELRTWYRANYEEFVALTQKYLLYKPSSSIKTHLITFTMKPGLDKEQFAKAVDKQLSRNLFARVKYTSEHHDTNYHFHAWVTTRYSITTKRFESHAKRWGHVDVRKPGFDNGIDTYFTKEDTIKYKALGADATELQYDRVQIEK